MSDLDQLLEALDPESRRLGVQRLARSDGTRFAEAPRLLVRALGDEDWRVRKEAAAVAPLLSARSDLIRLLSDCLGDKENIGLRNSAVEALVAIGPDVVPVALELMDRFDADGRKLVIELLGKLANPRGVEALALALDDADANIRWAAAEALGNAGMAGAESRDRAISALSVCLERGEIQRTIAALDALWHLDARLPWKRYAPLVTHPLLRRQALRVAARSPDEDALFALIAAMGDPLPAITRDAVIAFAERISSDAPPSSSPSVTFLARVQTALRANIKAHASLRAICESELDTKARHAALSLLGFFQDEADAPLLVEAIDDEELREHAFEGLTRLGAAALHPLMAALPGRPPAARVTLLELLTGLAVRFGAGEDPRVLPLFRERLDDPSIEVTLAALHGMAKLGHEDDMDRLIAGTTHPDTRAAMAFASALQAMSARHPEAARARLQALAAGSQTTVAGCALIGSLADAGRSEPSDTSFLERALSHGDRHTRRVAVEVLSRTREKHSADLIAFALADEERDVRLAAVRALGTLGKVEALATLVASTSDHELLVAALRTLLKHDPTGTARDLLQERLEREKETMVREAIAGALAITGGGSTGD